MTLSHIRSHIYQDSLREMGMQTGRPIFPVKDTEKITLCMEHIVIEIGHLFCYTRERVLTRQTSYAHLT